MRYRNLFICVLLIFSLSQKSTQVHLRNLQSNSDESFDSDAGYSDYGNSTVDIPPSTATSKLILVGFGDYNQPNNTMITFNIFFKRINTNIILRFVTFLIKINCDDRLRTLEEEEKNITCPLNEEESTGDDLQFDCSSPIDEGKVINTVGVDDDSIHFDQNVETLSSSYANGTKDDISTQTDSSLSKGIILLDSGVLSSNKTSFNITGTISPSYNGTVILSLDENGKGSLKNVTCTVTTYENGTGILQCTPQNSVKSRLNGVSGAPTSSEKMFLISMGKNEDDLVTISSPVKNTYRNKSNNGLSGGAIAGIIVACVAALIAIGIVAFLCRNPSKLPLIKQREESNLGMYTSQSGTNKL